jgi:DNA-binding response OmpR family regulator
MQTISVLVVDEDELTRAFLADNLLADGYEVTVADRREKALALLSVHRYELVIADVNGQTLGLLDAVRGADGLAGRIDPDTPLIALTGRAGELHRVRVLEHGGDDIVAKPFSYPELRARIAAVIRRTQERPGLRVQRVGPLTVDTRRREAKVSDRSLELTCREYELLRALAADPGRVFTRAELMREVWGLPATLRTRTLDSHVARVRRKLAEHGVGHLLVNVWGVGYRLDSGSSR